MAGLIHILRQGEVQTNRARGRCSRDGREGVGAAAQFSITRVSLCAPHTALHELE